MYKIIKIDEKQVILGNVEDNSLKRVSRENSYESAQVGDFVELFSDGDTVVIVKQENKKSFSLDQINLKDSLSMDKLDFSEVVPNITKSFEKMIEYLKDKQTYISSALYLVIVFSVCAIVTLVMNDEISKILNSSFGNSIFDDTFSVSPLLVLGNALLANVIVVMSDGGLFGSSMEMTVKVGFPIILLSFSSILIALLAVNRFILAQKKEESVLNHMLRLITVSLVGHVILAVLLGFYSQTMTDFIEVKLDVIPLILKGSLFVAMMAMFVGLSNNAKNAGANLAMLAQVKIKFILLMIVGLLGAVYAFAQTTWDSAILVGNYTFWFIAQSFGAQVVSQQNSYSSKLVDEIPNFGIVVVIMMILAILIAFIDVDELYSKYSNTTPLMFSIAYGTLMTIIIGILTVAANVSITGSLFGSSQKVKIGVDILGLFIPWLVITIASVIRLTLGSQFPIIEMIKEKYHSFVKVIRL